MTRKERLELISRYPQVGDIVTECITNVVDGVEKIIVRRYKQFQDTYAVFGHRVTNDGRVFLRVKGVTDADFNKNKTVLIPADDYKTVGHIDDFKDLLGGVLHTFQVDFARIGSGRIGRILTDDFGKGIYVGTFHHLAYVHDPEKTTPVRMYSEDVRFRNHLYPKHGFYVKTLNANSVKQEIPFPLLLSTIHCSGYGSHAYPSIDFMLGFYESPDISTIRFSDLYIPYDDIKPLYVTADGNTL